MPHTSTKDPPQVAAQGRPSRANCLEQAVAPAVVVVQAHNATLSGRLLAGVSSGVVEAHRLPDGEVLGTANGRWSARFFHWVSGVLAGSLSVLGLWYGCYRLYFIQLQELGCSSALEAEGRSAIHWFLGWAPAAGRTAVLLALAGWCYRKVFQIPGHGLAQALLLGGVGREDGAAENAGWLAMVGGDGALPQATWTQARLARVLTQRQALGSAVAKLVLWHWSQPLAYLWLLDSFRCYVAELGPTQQYLSALVAAREVLYLASTLLALVACPSFLLLDLKTVWNEATRLQRITRLAMYLLCPQNYVAMCLANRFERCRQLFVCLAAVQVLADVSSCFALVNLMASNIEFKISNSTSTVASSDDVPSLQVDPVPLEIGYSVTALGFLLFFGPLMIVSSFQHAFDRQLRWVLLRFVSGTAGGILLCFWGALIFLLGWMVLVAGSSNPFCSGLPFLSDPCNSHGSCYGAGQCFCDRGYGPESKLSGAPLCSCPVGWSGKNCDVCEQGYLGQHCAVAFRVTGANGTSGSSKINGEYVRTARICGGKPVYEQPGLDGVVLSKLGSWAGWWISTSADCLMMDDGRQYVYSYPNGGGHCSASPDGSDCVGKWLDWHVHKSNPTLTVVAVGGAGCQLTPLNCGSHGTCVGRTANEPYDRRRCVCDSGWSGTKCDHDPCANANCNHGRCVRHRNGRGHTCKCTGHWSNTTCNACETGWSGADCTHSTGCDDAPCLHGNCTAKGGDYTCSCATGYIGAQCAVAFTVSGAKYSNFNGWYNKTDRVCNEKPVYQQRAGGPVLYRLHMPPSDEWRFAVSLYSNCHPDTTQGHEVTSPMHEPRPSIGSPDSVNSVGRWFETIKDVGVCDKPQSNHYWCDDASAITVVPC
eukprot:COSAG02_NODE_672_length_18655_cov_7.874003_7_plen_875_part_00